MGFLGLQFHDRGLKLLQHYVHGMRKGTHLGVFRQHGGAAIQVTVGNGLGGFLHFPQRPQGAPDHEVAQYPNQE